MIEIIIKLHKSDFLIYEVFLLIIIFWWYWTLFMGGARKWSEGIIKFWGPRWYLYQPLARPVILKIFMTLFLLGTLGGGNGIILNKIRNF